MRWADAELGSVATPRGELRLTLGVGSGLAQRRGDAPGLAWAVTDRGPNLHVSDAVGLYGLDHLAPLMELPGAKIMPRRDVGPEIVRLKTSKGAVTLMQRLPLKTKDGRMLSGLPLPGDARAAMEPVFGIDGEPLGVDPLGVDPEGIAAMADGSFWVAEEYGPSLMKVEADGSVMLRLMPEGRKLKAPGMKVRDSLPAIAAKRRLNRGFEAVTLSEDERLLHVAFQSALTEAGQPSRIVRFWTLDAQTGEFLAQHLYRFDKPETFLRDAAKKPVDIEDLKIGDLACVGPGRLIVLERIRFTTKLYVVKLADEDATPRRWLEPDRPLESFDRKELEKRGLSLLKKRLVLSSDDHPTIGPDIEGVAALSPTELMLVSDNDFGVLGARTGFWRVTSDKPFR
jgi:hypothetical protein